MRTGRDSVRNRLRDRTIPQKCVAQRDAEPSAWHKAFESLLHNRPAAVPTSENQLKWLPDFITPSKGQGIRVVLSTVAGPEAVVFGECSQFVKYYDTDSAQVSVVDVNRWKDTRAKNLLMDQNHDWPVAVQSIDGAIRKASEALSLEEGVKQIQDIWGQLEKLTELAAARFRLLSKKMDPPTLAETPNWFTEQLEEASEPEGDEPVYGSMSPIAVGSAELLVRAVLAVDVKASATIEPSINGRVAINWDLNNTRLQWLVGAPDYGWPGVLIHQISYPAPTGDRMKTTSKVLHSAFEAVKEYQQLAGY